MKLLKTSIFLAVVAVCAAAVFAMSARVGQNAGVLAEIDSLNRVSYSLRYKDLRQASLAASRALQLSAEAGHGEDAALNNSAFCSFMEMDFEKSEYLFKKVTAASANELECLVADVGLMKICQRTSSNKEFFDHMNSVLKRMDRIRQDGAVRKDSLLSARFGYAVSEFHIVSGVYYYYLQQYKESLAEIDAIDASVVKQDTAQWLNYLYMRGSGGMLSAPTREELVVAEFEYLVRCFTMAQDCGYVYFQANALQAMAETLNFKDNRRLLLEKKKGWLQMVNEGDCPPDSLPVALARKALGLFKEYGDWYQISGAYRTIATYYNYTDEPQKALPLLDKALMYVNKHHEKYYHCTDTADRLKTYDQRHSYSVELAWINDEGIKTVPEWIARLREQLSRTYSAMGMKQQSDYNRNMYLDILDYTRQDKELVSRYEALENEAYQLNVLLGLVMAGLLVLVVLFVCLNRIWKRRNARYIEELKKVLEICRNITASVPADVSSPEDVAKAVEDVVKQEDRSFVHLVKPYMDWTIENGLDLMALTDERLRLEHEDYMHRRHIAENKRQNVVKKACLSIVMGIMPYIDRVVNETGKLKTPSIYGNAGIRNAKLDYIGELLSKINDYNEILTIWIKMKQGDIALNVENFCIGELFSVIAKGRRTFEMKGLGLEVEDSAAVVKADKALTMFMINTLSDNARKYTGKGGNVKIFASEEDDYVEVSVEDNGPGVTAADIDGLRKKKGHGFGLMNCNGIIDKYRKTNPVFKVCTFGIDSKPGQGSRFYFRLPKGVKRTMAVVALALVTVLHAGAHTEGYDSLLSVANSYADKVYFCNVNSEYEKALVMADSAFFCLNEHYRRFSGKNAPLLTSSGSGEAPELAWLKDGFDTDYYIILDVRNEVAVASLAVKDFGRYYFNNMAYTALYKQISEDKTLERYCMEMQESSANKTVAVTLLVLLMLGAAVAYYMLYLRHTLRYRYNLEQVIAVSRSVFSSTGITKQSGMTEDVCREMVGLVFKDINELVAIDDMAIGVFDETDKRIHTSFFSSAKAEEVVEMMEKCFGRQIVIEDGGWVFMPLRADVQGGARCIGVMALKCDTSSVREEDKLMVQLTGEYIAVALYKTIVQAEKHYNDIELARDETKRSEYEENKLHVQNMVLDNCLSTIKHETLYYPGQLAKMAAVIRDGGYEGKAAEDMINDMAEMAGYYRDVFTLLSSCASRQIDEVVFRRSVVSVSELMGYVTKYYRKVIRKLDAYPQLTIECAEELYITGDETLLRFMLENLVDEALRYASDGTITLRAGEEDGFARFDFIDSRRCFTQKELDLLFYPDNVRIIDSDKGDATGGTEYLVCKQIIRDHDEYGGRRGCRINATSIGGGFSVWFTLPLKKM